jgi:hypothetical protein
VVGVNELVELRREFYRLAEAGRREEAHLIALELVRRVPDDEKPRWADWVELTRPGRRIKFSTFPAEVLVGPALEAVERARADLADDAGLAEELGGLS